MARRGEQGGGPQNRRREGASAGQDPPGRGGGGSTGHGPERVVVGARAAQSGRAGDATGPPKPWGYLAK